MATKKISQLYAAGALAGEEIVEVSVLSDTVTITAATISADGDDNSFNDSGAGFVAAGFGVGDNVKVIGFTGNVANNLYSGRVTALTTGKMTIGGTDGDVIVDDAAGESVTITKWTTRRTTTQEIADLAGGGGGGDTIYRIGFFWTTALEANEVAGIHVLSDDATFADDFADSVADVGSNPAGTYALDVQKNGASVGTISISSGGVVTFSTTGGSVSFVAGDVMRVVGPATPDTAEDVAITFKGVLD